jgi:transaldolase/glucose-6-phosphate isomerase
MKHPIQTLHSLGQSLWYDNIQRRMLENGELKKLIANGELRGMTSNPSIFNAAIAKSSDYDSALKAMAWSGFTSQEILDRLVIEDIRMAAGLFLPLYKESRGNDGYVSVEVGPHFARDTQGTLDEAVRLWSLAGHPNVMIKIPATKEGLPAIRQAIARGMNVNVTLIFSIARYLEVMDAYLSGLEDRKRNGEPLDRIVSVASFFVSRIDSKVDYLLDLKLREEGNAASEAVSLKGKLAVASARIAYDKFKQTFNSERFASLKAAGANVQRPLWASTSTKNPEYPDTLYVDELVGPDTVNTVPQNTLDAFRDHGKPSLTIEKHLDQAYAAFEGIESLGVSMGQVTEELEQEGVKAFADAFDALMKTVEERRLAAVAELGDLAGRTAARVEQMQAENIPGRLRSLDPTIWSEETAARHEIRKRLGWINLPEKSIELLPDIRYFAEEIRSEGFQQALLLGMGGSSLAPEVNREVFGVAEGWLDVIIVDTTDPQQVRDADSKPVEKTLYIVSSKSGTTAEVEALLNYFWNKAVSLVGNHALDQFVAITDPGTPLEALAKERGFRRIFQGEPKVGGRFSALSVFGLVPTALLGVDIDRLLDRAHWMLHQTAPDLPAGRNPGIALGAVLGEAALTGRDKLTLIAGNQLMAFGAWLEQLIAESSGKDGKGIIPVVGEPLGSPEQYGPDRIFVYLRLNQAPETKDLDAAANQLQEAGFPVLSIELEDEYDLGAEYYRWGLAVAVACAVLGVNAFDQPDVQDTKSRTHAWIDRFHETGKLQEETPLWEAEGIRLYGNELPGNASLAQILDTFLDQGLTGDYIALTAYLPRKDEFEQEMGKLRAKIFSKTGLPVTVGFGPRFLHSTGQLHKGGPNSALFLQITADPDHDLEIPGEGMTFGILERAQALGDLDSLLARGRRALRVHLSSPADFSKVLAAIR